MEIVFYVSIFGSCQHRCMHTKPIKLDISITFISLECHNNSTIYHAQRALARENAEIQNNRNYNYARNRMLEYFQAHYYVEFMWFAFTSVYIVCTMHKMLWC